MAKILIKCDGAGERAREKGLEWAITQFQRVRERVVIEFDNRFAIVCTDPVVVVDRANPMKRSWSDTQWLKTLPRVKRTLGGAWFDAEWAPRYPSMLCLPGPNGERVDPEANSTPGPDTRASRHRRRTD